ncbi:MFS domain-containing protein [Mycena venus]|uniref:MFS domain-containing protein n=1 Tax=Mycena venus TaxID=2733690 RepID=A0A8H6U1Q4_9AGAR|nr:MFS domain-containing protein [Mycena venus]
MARGPVERVKGANAYADLMDPRRRWYNNRLVTASTSGYDGSMMNGLQSLPQWEDHFTFPTKEKLGLPSSIQNIGALAGYPFARYLSDFIERRPTVFIGALLTVIVTAIQTTSQSVGMFIGARFRIGFGLTFAASAAPMIVFAFAYLSCPLSSHLTDVVDSAAWATFGSSKIHNTWAWWLPSALQAVPSLVQLLMEAQALKILSYYHADGDESDPLVRYELEEIMAAMKLDRTSEHGREMTRQEGEIEREAAEVESRYSSAGSEKRLWWGEIGRLVELLNESMPYGALENRGRFL